MVILYGESEALTHILGELRKAKLPLYSLEHIKDFQENWENYLHNHEQQQQEGKAKMQNAFIPTF